MPADGRSSESMEQPNSGPLEECDIVMKGGVASGLVYTRTFTILSRKYRFRSIAGSSAGAIAAAFVAAAEYARQGGDPTAFARLQETCEVLPRLFPGFFQAEPRFKPLMRALIHLAPGTGRARLSAALLCFWRPILSGAMAGLAILILVYLALGVSLQQVVMTPVAAPGLFLGVTVGAAAWLTGLLARLLVLDLPRSNFGLSKGHNAGTGAPDITDWIHAMVQGIAFGAAGRAEPLTFGDLTSRGIDLRIIATNLNFGRMEVLPVLSVAARFRTVDWVRLFPPAVLERMTSNFSADLVDLPQPAAFPVLAAVRMSIACPGLLEAVPAYSRTGERLLFADGGLTRNFPFDIFDELVPERPTLAFDLATLHDGKLHGEGTARVTTLSEDLTGPSGPASILGLQGFVWALVVALREGATRTAMLAAPNQNRIFQVWLTPDEGGMNLDMSERQATDLMAYGEALGEHALRRFDFAAHRAGRLAAARQRSKRSEAATAELMESISPDEALR